MQKVQIQKSFVYSIAGWPLADVARAVGNGRKCILQKAKQIDYVTSKDSSLFLIWHQFVCIGGGSGGGC